MDTVLDGRHLLRLGPGGFRVAYAVAGRHALVVEGAAQGISLRAGEGGRAQEHALPGPPPWSVALDFAPGLLRLSCGERPLGTLRAMWPHAAPCHAAAEGAAVLVVERALAPPALAPPPPARPPRPPPPDAPVLPGGLSPGHRFAGALEALVPGRGLMGWAAEPGAPPRAITVEAWAAGQRLGLAATVLDRPDIAAFAGAGWHAGFRLGAAALDRRLVARLAAARPDEAVALHLPEAPGRLRSLLPGPSLAALDAALAAEEPEDLAAADARLRPAGLLDAAWYAARWGVAGDALRHYLTQGERAGLAPSPWLEPWRVAVVLGLPTLEGALEAYWRDPAAVPQPGLRFDAAWRARVAPAWAAGMAAHIAAPWRVPPNPLAAAAWQGGEGAPSAPAEDPALHAALLRWTRPAPAAARVAGPVSAAVVSYAQANHLPACLAGVFAQDGLREAVLLDDASPDRGAAVAEEMALHHGWPLRLRVNGRRGGNVQRQWRAALDCTAGEFLWIAEADDVAEPALVAALLARLRAAPRAAFAFCDPFVLDDAGRRVAEGNTAYYAALGEDGLSADGGWDGATFLRRFLCPRNLVLNVSAVLWRRAALEEAFAGAGEEAFAFTVAGDWRLYVAACEAGWGAEYLAAPLAGHRRHAASVTGRLDRPAHLGEVARVHARLAALLGPEAEAGMERVRADLRAAWGIGQDGVR